MGKAAPKRYLQTVYLALVTCKSLWFRYKRLGAAGALGLLSVCVQRPVGALGVMDERTMDDQMGNDTPKKGRWQGRRHTGAPGSLVLEVWEWVRGKDVTLPNVRQLAESIAELPTTKVRLTVWFTGLSVLGKTTIYKSVHAEF